MRIVESHVPIHFPKCDMVQNIKYRLPLERHDKNARGKHKQKTTLGIIQSKEGGGNVRKPKHFDTNSSKTDRHYSCRKRMRLFRT